MGLDKTKLFCIPFSGGNAYSYNVFRKHLPENIELETLELPGRGKRIAEALLHTIDEMTVDLFRQVENKLTGNYVIFGHSLGALLGYTLCKCILAKGHKPPAILFLSGLKGASAISYRNLSGLSDSQFTKIISDMAGTPEELLADKSFLDYFLPVLRADFQAIVDYRYSPPNDTIEVPMVILLGEQEAISDNDANAWQQETIGNVSIHRFEGGHFFINKVPDEVCKLISEKCAQLI